MAGRVPLENVSGKKTKWTHAVRTTALNFRNYQIAKNSMQQNEIYNIPLPRGPGPKNQTQKKATKVG
jgi:hypothetical protein